jgi:CubicO group peptidase (beta-lactamase class C family)
MSLESGLKILENKMQEAIHEQAFPGVSYTIVTKDKRLFGYLGDKAWFPKIEPLVDNTIYDLASLTKVVSTTTAIFMLIEEGKIRLIDPVRSILNRFTHEDICIFHLLTHTSGLPADLPRAATLKTVDEVVDKVYNQILINPVGEKIVYSDIGYILLGLIVQEVSGITLDLFVKEHIFKPLKMNDTGYNPVDVERCAPTELREDSVYQGYLKGKVHDEKSFALGGLAGHAGLFSTHKDLANFIQMILNDGVFEGKQILSKSTIDLLYRTQIEEKSMFGRPYRRTYGWELTSLGYSCGDLVSQNTLLHTGFTGTSIFIDRENQIGMAILTNHVHPKRGKSALFRYRSLFANITISKVLPFLK